MGLEFNVDTDEVVALTNKLETLTRSAFPVAVRTTLNSLAFDVKKNTMPDETERTFDNRKKNFFTSSSRVNMATGFDVDHMQSVVGFRPFPGSEQAVEDLEQQERGGTIDGRSFIPLDTARTSKSHKRLVSRKNRIGTIRGVVNIKDARGSNRGQRFVKSVVHAGEGGHLLAGKTLFRIQSISRTRGRTRFRMKALYNYRKGRAVKVRATHFMERSAMKSAEKANDFYREAAEKQFKKHLQ